MAPLVTLGKSCGQGFGLKIEGMFTGKLCENMAAIPLPQGRHKAFPRYMTPESTFSPHIWHISRPL
ncbi:MAG: hypothetical protein ACYDBI_05825 [Thermoplasmataceae archaeon]